MEIQRNETRNTKSQMVLLFKLFWPTILIIHNQLEILSTSTGKSIEEVEKDINRPRYFDPQEAKENGLIDKVKKQLHFHLRYICLKNSSTGTIRMKDI